jgi:3-dehydroquinate dehydratase-2
MKKILIINGPNLNMLGLREVDVYGSLTLKQIQEYTEAKMQGEGVHLEWFQSNIEGELVDKLQYAAGQNYAAVILNPGAYGHTSVAIYDAIKILKIPVVEVHLSNVYKRESFRESLLTAKACVAIMSGLGKDAYWLAIKSQI